MHCKILLIAGNLFSAVVKQDKFIGKLQQALRPAQSRVAGPANKTDGLNAWLTQTESC